MLGLPSVDAVRRKLDSDVRKVALNLDRMWVAYSALEVRKLCLSGHRSRYLVRLGRIWGARGLRIPYLSRKLPNRM